MSCLKVKCFAFSGLQSVRNACAVSGITDSHPMECVCAASLWNQQRVIPQVVPQYP